MVRIASLEEAREQRDREEDAQLNTASTRRAHLKSSKAGGARASNTHGGSQEGVSGEDESEFEDDETSSSESLPGEEDEKVSPKVPAKKVCLTHTF